MPISVGFSDRVDSAGCVGIWWSLPFAEETGEETRWLVSSNSTLAGIATIKARKRADGAIRYTAIVRQRIGKATMYRDAKTFTHRTAAVSWARHREVELENAGAETLRKREPVPLAELVRWYIDSFQSISRWRRSGPSSAIRRLECREVAAIWVGGGGLRSRCEPCRNAPLL